MKKVFFLFLFILITLNSFGQKFSNLAELKSTYQNYFQLNREYLHLHLNKTKFAPRESLWLAAYAYDLSFERPNLLTTNLNVSVFNEQGEQLDYKTFYINQGFGEGYFNLNTKKYQPGIYYLKASTNFQKNFKENLSFTQAFQIVGNTKEENGKANEYDLQLLPEGGHLLENTFNNVGIKVINQKGKGVFFTDGKIIDETGKTITTFKSNLFGISKFSIIPENSKTYFAKLKTDLGDEVELKLPKAELFGLTLQANNFLEEQAIISIKTNKSTHPKIKSKPFYLVVHQNNQFSGTEFTFPSNKLEQNVVIKRDQLYPGLNTITVFDHDFKPILERMLFNTANLKRNSVSASLKENLIDSLVIEVSSDQKLDTLQKLSVSVLPEQTKSYQPNHNILSSILLKPYINSPIENGGYYFKTKNEKKRLYNLDLLLITQGWSSYDWKNIFNFQPKVNYESEIGFSINGKVLNRNEKKEEKLFIKSNKTSLFEVGEIERDNSFKFKHLYIEDSTEVSFGLINSKSEKIKNTAYAASVTPFKKLNQNLETKINYFEKLGSKSLTQQINQNFITGAQSLDTVVLSTEKEIETNSNLIFGDLKIIDEEITQQYIYILDYIETQGFRVQSSLGDVTIASRRAINLQGYLQPLIILDGMYLTENYNILSNILTSEVESIGINKDGLGYGMRGSGGVIEIVTKRGGSTERNNINPLFSILAKNGFTAPKEFYAPRYATFSSQLFEDYGAIYWTSNIVLDENNKKTTFKIANTLIEGFTLYIEGMSTNGSLISEEIIINYP